MKQEDRKKLISSLGGIVSVVAGFIGAIKDVGVSPWIWGSALVVGALMAMAPYVRDIYNVIAKCITPFFTPDISWHNDGFAYMTIDARFKDNFSKATGVVLLGNGNQYNRFLKESVMNADAIVALFPDGKDVLDSCKALPYGEKLAQLMTEYNLVGGNRNIQYLFEHTPFIFAEHYYFYHILKLSGDADPWANEKRESLKRIVDAPEEENRITKLVSAYNNNQLDRILNQSVFANSTDLSQQRAVVSNAESCGDNDVSDYIISDKKAAQDYINKSLGSDAVIHIVVDNSGIELISDLVLGKYLLKMKPTANIKIVYHHNVLPIFVSDAVSADFHAAIEAIGAKNKELGDALKQDVESGKMVFAPNAFWNMPFPFKEMPKSLLDEFNNENVGMIIIKGDLNYRRLVEDKQWRITERIEPHVEYFQRPILILRSLKSNTLLGVNKMKLNSLKDLPATWKTTGDYGMIQFIEK